MAKIQITQPGPWPFDGDYYDTEHDCKLAAAAVARANPGVQQVIQPPPIFVVLPSNNPPPPPPPPPPPSANPDKTSNQPDVVVV